MRSYTFHTPGWLQLMYPDYLWKVRTSRREVFLTFDDGPEPTATEYVLEQLEQYAAKATFFCVGQNVCKYPDLFREILEHGHAVGNHTFSHANGWKTKSEVYLEEVMKFEEVIKSYNLKTSMFRPPFGRLRKSQRRTLTERFNIIMWSHLSGDFDKNLHIRSAISALLTAREGSIFLFHDSFAALNNLKQILPPVLEYYSKAGYVFKSLSEYEVS